MNPQYFFFFDKHVFFHSFSSQSSTLNEGEECCRCMVFRAAGIEIAAADVIIRLRSRRHTN